MVQIHPPRTLFKKILFLVLPRLRLRFSPVYPGQCFNSGKLRKIRGNQREFVAYRLPCDQHIISTDRLADGFEFSSNRSGDFSVLIRKRKRVERAKSILAREKKMPEEEAFRLIQKQSMNTRRSMREIADAVILTSQIKS